METPAMKQQRLLIAALLALAPFSANAEEPVCKVEVYNSDGYFMATFDGNIIGGTVYRTPMEAQKVVKENVDSGACVLPTQLPVCKVAVYNSDGYYMATFDNNIIGGTVYRTPMEAYKVVQENIASGACTK
jgi:hypothetical protein